MAFSRWLAAVSAALLVSAGVTGAALAQSGAAYPDHALKLIVPFSPGGGGDLVARLMGEALSKRVGQPVLVENKPGADQIIGTTALTQSPPDGYTLMLTGSTMMVHAAYDRKLSFNPFKDLVPTGKIVNVPVILIAGTKLGVKSIPELAAAARARPGEVKVGHIGNSSLHFFSFKVMEQALGIRFLEVPYKGTAPVTAALLANEIDLMFSGIGAGVQLADSGRGVVLGVSGRNRSATAPNVPTLAQAGVPGFALNSEFYFYVPGGTPAPVIGRINRETRAILEDKAIRTRLEAAGFDVEWNSPEDALAEHQLRYDTYRKLITSLGLKYE